MQELSLSKIAATFTQLLKWWFPKSPCERYVLLASFLFYFTFSTLLSQMTSLIDAALPGYWGYFGYDNSWYTNVYFGIESFDGYFLSRHPLIKLFFLPMMGIGYFLQATVGSAAKLFFYLLIFNLITSMSVMLVFRYLMTICRIGIRRSILLTVMFAFFFTNILLAFTPESFPVSQMLMLTAISIMSFNTAEKISPAQFLVLSLLNIGVTTTNIVKVIIPYMYTGEILRKKLKTVCVVLIALACFYAVYMILFGSIFLHPREGQSIPAFLYEQYFFYNMNISPFTHSFFSPEYLDLALNRFWCGGLMAPSFLVGGDPTMPDAPYIPVPQFGDFSWYHSIIGMSIFLLFVFGLCRQWRDRRVQILIVAFSFDCFLHLILLFGYVENHIYAAHWFFLVPLSIGFLYASINNRGTLRLLDGTIVLLTSFLAVLNLNGYYRFFAIAYEHLPR
jgi:hypothetical protein